MGIIRTDSQYYSDIAAAIRKKTGGEGSLKPADMAPALDAATLDELIVTPGTEAQTFEAESPCIGFKKVTVEAAEYSEGEGGGEIIEELPVAEETTFGVEGRVMIEYPFAVGSHVCPPVPTLDTTEYPYQVLFANGDGSVDGVSMCVFYFVAMDSEMFVEPNTGDGLDNELVYLPKKSDAVYEPGSHAFFGASDNYRLQTNKIAVYKLSGGVRETKPEGGVTYRNVAQGDAVWEELYHITKPIGPVEVETDVWSRIYEEYNIYFPDGYGYGAISSCSGVLCPNGYYSAAPSIREMWSNYQVKLFGTGEVCAEPFSPRKIYVERADSYEVQGDTMNELIGGIQDLADSEEPMSPEDASDFINSYVPPEIQPEATVTPGLTAQTVVPESGYDGIAKVIVEATPLEDATVTPTAAGQVLTPSEGILGFKQVTVEGIPLQEKTAWPTAWTDVVVEADAEYAGLSKVTVKPAALEEVTVTPTTEEQVLVPSDGYLGFSQVTVPALEAGSAAPVLQEKSVSPSTEALEVVADEGYDGLSKVSVAAMKLQEKDVTVTFGATTYVEPDEGYDGLSYVSIVSEAPKSEEITVTPTDTAQIILPNYDEGYQYISKVTVLAAESGGTGTVEELQSAMEVSF